MREKLKYILDLLINRLAYYVLGALVITVLMGFFFNFSNAIVNGVVKTSLFIFLESLFTTLLILKVYDIRDDIREKNYFELLPLSRTNTGYFFLYLVLMVGSMVIFI